MLTEVRLDALLSALELELDPFAVCDVRRDWSVAMPAGEQVAIHFNLRGHGRITAAQNFRQDFGPGSLLVIPHGVAHRIELPDGSSNVLDATVDCRVEHGLRQLEAGAGDGGVLMVCGAVRVRYSGGLDLFAGLREPLVVTFDDPSVAHLFHSMLEEQSQMGPGSRAMLEALMMQCLIALFRQLCSEEDCKLPWLAGLEDPRLAKALDAIVTDPAAPHSLESLAAIAGMSRSSFAQHFTRAFDRPAMEFVRELRLRKAARTLRSSDDSVAVVAESVGFASRSHFSKAFRAAYGLDPAGYREAGRG